MALNTPANRLELIRVFPNLKEDTNFQILSPQTPVYNCIAWAMGYTDRWVDPYIGPGCWWPDGVIRSYSSDALIKAFEAEGFELSDNELLEEGYAKVVLYKKHDDDLWTHASKLVSADVEYSKFGRSFDGQHSHNVLCTTSDGHEKESYGISYAIMKKKLTHGNQQTSYGTIGVNIALLQELLKKRK